MPKRIYLFDRLTEFHDAVADRATEITEDLESILEYRQWKPGETAEHERRYQQNKLLFDEFEAFCKEETPTLAEQGLDRRLLEAIVEAALARIKHAALEHKDLADGLA